MGYLLAFSGNWQPACLVRSAALPRLLQNLQRCDTDAEKGGTKDSALPYRRLADLCWICVLRLADLGTLSHEVPIAGYNVRVLVCADKR